VCRFRAYVVTLHLADFAVCLYRYLATDGFSYPVLFVRFFRCQFIAGFIQFAAAFFGAEFGFFDTPVLTRRLFLRFRRLFPVL
jgi:hypothetical protein